MKPTKASLEDKLKEALNEGDSYSWGEGGYVAYFDKYDALAAIMRVLKAEGVISNEAN